MGAGAAPKAAIKLEPTCVEAYFYPHLPPLLKGALTRRVRLHALELTAGTRYAPSPQMSLFAEEPRAVPRAKLAHALDVLRQAYGEGAVTRPTA